LKIVTICEGSWASNCYALISGGHALIVDPSVSVARIAEAVAREGAVIDAILLTHGHFDHIISLDTLRDKLYVPAMIHKDDAEMLSDGKKNAFFTFFGKDRRYRDAEHLLSDNDIIPLGDESVRVIHTPGHSKGSVCSLAGDMLISGDTLFADSFGRYDLHGGDPTALRASLALLRTLNKELTIYPGHGEEAKLGSALDNVAYFI